MQNWNNLIQYIRYQLGSINQLEITDDELRNYIKEHTLLDFSNHSPNKLWVLITDSNRMPFNPTIPDRIMDEDTYKIPLSNENDYIINVENAYYRKGTSDFFDEYPYMLQTDPRDVVMNNTMSTMLDYLDTVQYYQFMPPDTIVFGERLGGVGVILELNIVHTNLDNIKRDIYQNLFKKMALRDTLQMIIANRSKFQQLSSPFGEISLNIEFLEKKLDKIEQDIQEYQTWELPEKLVAWIE